MSKELTEVNVDNIATVLDQLHEAYYDIPFENSDFQNRAFVMAAQQTPARAYRAVGLRMFSKLHAVKKHLMQRKRNDIDLREKQHRLANENLTEFDVERLQLDVVELQDGLRYADKLLNDAIRELNCLYAEFKKLPRYTREGFEREEEYHFHNKLTRMLNGQQGAAESLLNMQEDLPQLEQRVEQALSDPHLTFLTSE
jgi:hypothetical protein